MSEPRLTHVDASGAARMVDVSGKDVTVRTATATGRVLVSPDVVALLGQRLHESGTRHDAAALVPLYLRPTEAELKFGRKT